MRKQSHPDAMRSRPYNATYPVLDLGFAFRMLDARPNGQDDVLGPTREPPMKRMIVPLLCLFVVLAPAVHSAEKRPMTVADLFRFKRVADPQISPDSKQVVYTVTTAVDVTSNKPTTHRWLPAVIRKTQHRHP